MAKMPKIPDLANFKAPPSGECRRIALWIFWTLNMLLDLVYMALAFATCDKLLASLNQLDALSFDNHAWQAPVAACAIGGLMVLLFNILSCLVLIRKSINKSGPGFGYGLIMSWSFCMAWMNLLCGLIMDGFTSTVTSDLEQQTNWSKYWSGTYIGTIAFNFICAVMFLLMFLCLVIFQGGISKTVGLYDPEKDEKRRLQMALYASAPAGVPNPLTAGPVGPSSTI